MLSDTLILPILYFDRDRYDNSCFYLKIDDTLYVFYYPREIEDTLIREY